MNSVPILHEAKKEYTNKLQQILAPRLYEGFKSIFEDILRALSDEMIENNHQSASAVKVFQKSLKEIPTWNNDMIRGEYSRIEKISKCDYLEDLLEAVFVSNIQILTSIQLNNNKSSVNISVPQPHTFMHKCYIECSKELYKNPYIFDTRSFTPKERHSNLRESLSLINQSIENAIRELLPIREILKQGILEKSSKSNDFDNISEEQEVTNESSESDEDSNNEQENVNSQEMMNTQENNMKEKEEENGINIPNLMDNQVQDIEDNDNDNGNPPPIEFGGKKSVSLSNLFLGGNKEDFSDVESQISLSDDDLSYNPHTTLFYEEAEDSLMDHIKNMTSKKYLKNLKVDELKEILRKNNQKITEKGNYLSKQNLIKRVIKMYK